MQIELKDENFALLALRNICSKSASDILKFRILSYHPKVLNKPLPEVFMPPLALACRNKNTAVVQYLMSLEKININGEVDTVKTKDEVDDETPHDPNHGYTPLHHASIHGHLEIVAMLFSHPAIDVNRQNQFEETPLLRISGEERPEVVKLLLSHSNIDVNRPDRNGDTPLHKASYSGQLQTVQLLLSHSTIQVNVHNKAGEHALYKASYFGHLEVVRMLLSFDGMDRSENLTKVCRMCCRGGDIKKKPEIVKLIKDFEQGAKIEAPPTVPLQTSIPEVAPITSSPAPEPGIVQEETKNPIMDNPVLKPVVPEAPLSLAITPSPRTKIHELKPDNLQKPIEPHENHQSVDAPINQGKEKPETAQNNVSKESTEPHMAASLPVADEEEYMKEALAQGKKQWGRSKIMLVGEGRAGKTALANSILGRHYESTQSTVGINEFTCNVGYASVSGSVKNEGKWSEYKVHKQQREYETALAKMISDRKAGRAKKGAGKGEVEFELLLNDKAKGGYVGNNDVRLLTSAELERGKREGKVEPDRKHETPMITEMSEPIAGAGVIRPTLNQSEIISSEAAIVPKATDSIHEVAGRGHSEGTGKVNGKLRKVPEGQSKPTQTKKKKEMIDKSLVMQYLGEQSCANSKFIISVFDFGGQSVFNVIHPFFLTRFGVYVLVFNMEWLASSATREVKEDCLSYLTFWLNSIIIHTQNEKEEVAPIFFVGTRKDLISSPAEHLQISTKIYEVFSGSLAWPYVVDNVGAEGPNGMADLCFYPVNNTLSNNDQTVQKLLKKIEETIDASSYVHVERPLSWFQVLDSLKQEKAPYLSYEEASRIIQSCQIPEDKVPLLLKFFHEMGILMWHDEDKLRDVVVFDPIEYFVKPATIIICKHVPDEADGIHHVLDIHRTVRKMNARDFQEMTRHGIVTEKLLQGLLQGHEANYDHIRLLMLKYGLLIPLTLQEVTGAEHSAHEKEHVEHETLYLAPALLPESKTSDGSKVLLEGSISTQFYFIFTPSSELGKMTTISLEDCRHLGFLPNGLFEKLISKAIMWSMKTSDFVSRATLYGCYKNAAELAFGNQTFRIFADPRHHMISVIVDGKNPVGVHDRLVDQLKEIIAECLKSLKFITVLRYEDSGHQSKAKSGSPEQENNVMFFRLDLIRSLVEKKTALSLNLPGGRSLLNAQDAMRVYGPWLVDYTAFEEYDMFISYRWGEHDSDFTLALFDRMTLYSVEESRRSIRAFLDRKRLKVGENFQSGFIKSLLKSLVMVPIVSVDALSRMAKLAAEEEDNVLIEWLCGLECLRAAREKETGGGNARMIKIMPVFFGSRSSSKVNAGGKGSLGESRIGNLFQEGIVDHLPSIVPKGSLLKAKSLLEPHGVVIHEDTMKMTVKGIVQEVCKYLFLCAWEIEVKGGKKSLITHTAEIVPELEAGLTTLHRRHSVLQGHIGHGGSGNGKSHDGSGGGGGTELSVNQLKELIKKELGLTTNSMQEITAVAFEDFTQDQKDKVNGCGTVKEKALMIAR